VKNYDSVGTVEVDYWMQYYDVIKNPRWRPAANMKIVMSAYERDKFKVWKIQDGGQICIKTSRTQMLHLLQGTAAYRLVRSGR